MNPRYFRGISIILALLLAWTALPASAAQNQDQSQPQSQTTNPASRANDANIASIWIIWVKQGQAQPFEAALKAHAAWRKNAGESFHWSIYQPVVGSDLGYYLIRSGDHTWGDIDANETWEQQHGAKEFESKAGQYVKRVEHYFAETDTAHSHWMDRKDYRYFGVTRYRFKPGTRSTVDEVMDKVQKAVLDANWPYAYSISRTIGGKGGLSIVEPMRSYADMAEPNPSLMTVLAGSLGSKESATQTMQRFDDSIDNTNYTVYAYRPDLSTPSDNP